MDGRICSGDVSFYRERYGLGISFYPRGSGNAGVFSAWHRSGTYFLMIDVPVNCMTGQLKHLVTTLLVCAMPLCVVAQTSFHFGYNKIQYEDFDWKVMETEHFDIYYYPEMLELAEKGAFFAEEAYGELQNRFNFSLNHRVPLIFYSSNLHFKQTNLTPGFIPDNVGGFFEFTKGRVVIPANGNLHRFRRVVRHELVHVFMFNKASRVMLDHRKPRGRQMPLWFTEGLAEYWSGEPDHQHELVLRDALYSNQFVPMESLFRIYGTFTMYKEGEAICRFLAETYGEDKLLQIVENFWISPNFSQILEITMQDSFANISHKFNVWLKMQYYPELPDLEVPSIIAGGLSSKGFNAKPTFYRSANGERSVYFVGNHSGFSSVFKIDLDDDYRPLSKPEILVEGGRNEKFEAFHLFESRLSISSGGKLAFVTQSGKNDVIHVYDLEKNRLEATYRFENLIAVYSPTWSPDATRIAFASIDESGYSDLYVYHIEEQQLQRLTHDSYDDRDPSWSPDGTRIAFISDRTPFGKEGSYNVFTYGVSDGRIQYVTHGKRVDFAPSWSPDGDWLIFSSSTQDSTGRFSAQDIWVADMSYDLGIPPALASVGNMSAPDEPPAWRSLRRITEVTSGTYDPVWTPDNRILFTAIEGLQFSIRQLPNADSLVATPRFEEYTDLAQAENATWEYESIKLGEGAHDGIFKKKIKLDLAQGAISQSPVLGTTGGLVLAFSDIMSNDRFFITLFNTGQIQGRFFQDISLQLSRVQLHKRANISYGIYRYAGLRYDVSDPDANISIPRFRETNYGGFGGVSYPISKFRRIEFSTSLNWSQKQIVDQGIQRDALLLSNSISIVHDNALYWINGPIGGWRARLMAAYTTDIWYSNVSYYSLFGDVRIYTRLSRGITLASRFMVGINNGREARLWVMGGSWDLRSVGLFDIRGRKIWFTSQELRFPVVPAPAIHAPLLEVLGVSYLGGALFVDAAHAWNDGYNTVQPEIFAGETIGAAGAGLRLNMFGVLVLRWDIGYRYRQTFKFSKRNFSRFFFGYNF